MAKKQFLYENVYNDLKHKIECGDLKPGDKLEVEEDMITHYGVSAITVKKGTESSGRRTQDSQDQRERQLCHGIPGSWQD